MSVKNITKREIKGNREHITFKTDTHEFTYSYNKRQQKSLQRGADPSDLSGRFESKKKI
jgi:hypothetical protein